MKPSAAEVLLGMPAAQNQSCLALFRGSTTAAWCNTFKGPVSLGQMILFQVLSNLLANDQCNADHMNKMFKVGLHCSIQIAPVLSHQCRDCRDEESCCLISCSSSKRTSGWTLLAQTQVDLQWHILLCCSLQSRALQLHSPVNPAKESPRGDLGGMNFNLWKMSIWQVLQG